MKKYMYCFLLFIATSIVCLIVGYAVTRYSLRQEQALPGTAVETETVNELENQVAVNQDEVKPILETGPVQQGPEHHLSLHPYSGHGFSGDGAGAADGGNLVSHYDGRLPLSGILYQLTRREMRPQAADWGPGVRIM